MNSTVPHATTTNRLMSGRNTPQWGRPGEQQSLHETCWDAKEGALIPQNTRKNSKPTPLKLPSRHAAIVNGLISLIAKVGTRPEWDSEYKDAARHYIIDVLDDFFTANTKPQKGKRPEYTGLTKAMKVLWRSSYEGVDILHLSRGAKIHDESKPATLPKRRPKESILREKPNILMLFPEVFAAVDAFLIQSAKLGPRNGTITNAGALEEPEAEMRQHRQKRSSPDANPPTDAKRRRLDGTTGWVLAKPRGEWEELVGEGERDDQEGMQVEPQPQTTDAQGGFDGGIVDDAESQTLTPPQSCQISHRPGLSRELIEARVAAITAMLAWEQAHTRQARHCFTAATIAHIEEYRQVRGSVYDGEWAELIFRGLRGVENEMQNEVVPTLEDSHLQQLRGLLDVFEELLSTWYGYG